MDNPASGIRQFVLRYQKVFTWAFIALLVYFLVFFNLTSFPKPWFDEGSHLHVPKTLVRYGVYADYSSDGFRYYGPTIGVGPTVMLPVAGVFKVFGIGLLQARFVMGLYLIAAVYVFYRLVKYLSGDRLALIASGLLISSRSVLLLNYGRQLLGEVPGLFFLILGLWLWFSRWENNNWKRLSLIGLLFGLAMITKYQYLLFILPMIGLAWFLNLVYYKGTSHLNFIIPGLIAGISFGIWQGITIRYLGPATMMENLALLRTSAEGAAFTFNPVQIANSLDELSSRAVYLGALLPALIYGFFISIPRNRDGQKWGVLFILVALNLAWYVVASIGWIRYAFLGLALSSIFIARLFYDITDGFKLELGERKGRRILSLFDNKNAYRFALIAWLGAIIAIPMAKNVLEIALPGPNSAQDMAAYLDANVPRNALIETWDPEMGFFTDHDYHYPPNELLALAVKQIYSGGEPVQNHYDYMKTESPEYLLVGTFSKWVNIYSSDRLSGRYVFVISFGDYDLYKRIK